MKKFLTLISVIAISLIFSATSFAETAVKVTNQGNGTLYVYLDNLPAGVEMGKARGYEAGGEVVANSSKTLHLRNSSNVLVTCVERFSKKKIEYRIADAGEKLDLVWDGKTIK